MVDVCMPVRYVSQEMINDTLICLLAFCRKYIISVMFYNMFIVDYQILLWIVADLLFLVLKQKLGSH